MLDKIKSYLNQGVTFVKEAYGELAKVHYPTPRETVQATIVVVVLSLIMALWLGLIDFFSSRGVSLLLR
jgi:preprotein translocase SecE subunit